MPGALRDGGKRVNGLAAIIGIPKASVSRRLAFMRHNGIAKIRKKGKEGR